MMLTIMCDDRRYVALAIMYDARRRETRSQKPDNSAKLQPLDAGACFIKDRMGYLAYYENV